ESTMHALRPVRLPGLHGPRRVHCCATALLVALGCNSSAPHATRPLDGGSRMRDATALTRTEEAGPRNRTRDGSADGADASPLGRDASPERGAEGGRVSRDASLDVSDVID